MLVRSGTILIKYWFAISVEEQEWRFRARISDPSKRWKIGPVDVASRAKWVDYSRAKDAMFTYTDINGAPWYVVKEDVKRHARLNCIHHLLQSIQYEDVPEPPVELPDLQQDPNYQRPALDSMNWVPEVYGGEAKTQGSSEVSE